MVLYGIGTDYILFFLFRYRERLRAGREPKQAVAEAVERAGEAIASAGGAVIVVVHGADAELAGHLPVASVRRWPSRWRSPCSPRSRWSRPSSRCSAPGCFWPSKTWRASPRRPVRRASASRWATARGLRRASPACVLAVLAAVRARLQPHLRPRRLGSTEGRRVRRWRCDPAEGPAGRRRPTRRRSCCSSTDGERRSTPAALTSYAADARPQRDGRRARSAPAVPNTDGTTALFNVYLDRRPDLRRGAGRRQGTDPRRRPRRAPAGHQALVGGTTSVFVDFQKAMNRDYRWCSRSPRWSSC